MAVAHRRVLAGLVQPLEGVLAHRLQQPVARRPIARPRRPPATCRPAARAGRAPPRASTPSPAHDRLGRLQREAAGEDRQAAKQRPLRLGAAGRGSSRPSPAASAGAAGRSRPPPVSSRKRSSSRARDLLDRQHPHARGGQLQRQRDAVQPAADRAPPPRAFCVGRRAKPGRAARRPLDEQAHRVGPRAPVRQRRRRPPGRAAPSDGTRQAGLAGDAERLAAGGQHARRRAARAAAPRPARRRRRAGARSCPAPAAGAGLPEARTQPASDRLPRLLAHAQRARRRAAATSAGSAERRQLDQPDAVGERVDRVGGDLQRQAGLAAARRRRSASAGASPPARRSSAASAAADELGQLIGQVVGERVQRAQRTQVASSSGWASANTCSGRPRSRSRCSPRVHELDGLRHGRHESWVARERSVWPPWASARTRAQRRAPARSSCSRRAVALPQCAARFAPAAEPLGPGVCVQFDAAGSLSPLPFQPKIA